jgi:hypothetical protein
MHGHAARVDDIVLSLVAEGLTTGARDSFITLGTWLAVGVLAGPRMMEGHDG